ncbi:Chaperone protein dnaJ-like protein [Quillaja saponaria]|uniref:Chaperone protein dnaJ-like protein n=1 Tax=Quillaja saponaria TaxID=32244 RepID=A0AAD7LXP0_QUISA|nr:Chaperone protein dnaJ-like protein [Quillaja saponaria]
MATISMVVPSNFNSSVNFPSPPSRIGRVYLKPAQCAPLQQVQQQVGAGIMCEPCNGKGWLLCDFCKGQKTNVKAENNRIYRRCPSCKAVGYVLCSKCKVFKCVTFPNYNDGEDLSF